MPPLKLFQPLTVGDLALAHRVVLAPCGRCRADAHHVPSPLAPQYYSQRGSTPGTLLITEATLIDPQSSGMDTIPGIYSTEQVAAWTEVTISTLRRRCTRRARTSSCNFARSDGPYPYIAPSAIPLTGNPIAPRPLSLSEAHAYPTQFASAAARAVNDAGFDGVEIHGAHGYLIDQFLQEMSNNRTDAYGGSVENRVRFALEVVDAVVQAVGAKRTGIRLSPWSRFQDMGMPDPKPTFSHLVQRLRDEHPDLAYIHVVEPRVDAGDTRANGVPEGQSNDFTRESNDFIRAIWAPRPLISAGAYTRETGMQAAAEKGDLVAYGRLFIANPDLPRRLERDVPLTKGDRETYYVRGAVEESGYTDYPFAEGG
ncbi:hypothetical protein PLICRDRAFT_172133 [Plicaturopsis crispa FD-325 SS-3]|nr:hypothetical protein PLICRDRAFT_172133 [Plicaturopsis crispa FD-325 SS-3]